MKNIDRWGVLSEVLIVAFYRVIRDDVYLYKTYPLIFNIKDFSFYSCKQHDMVSYLSFFKLVYTSAF
jgi:hypothetical protein